MAHDREATWRGQDGPSSDTPRFTRNPPPEKEFPAMPRNKTSRRPRRVRSIPRLSALEPSCLLAGWAGYAHDAQHTADSSVAAQAIQEIVWNTPVDLNPQISGNDLLIHYGSPLFTQAGTVIVPVKTGAT